MGAKSKGVAHGAVAVGIGRPPKGGVMGPGGKFGGTTNLQDLTRTATSPYPRPVPSGVGIKKVATGGQSRKFAGGVGAQKATGI